jgi:hypothetical protein
METILTPEQREIIEEYNRRFGQYARKLPAMSEAFKSRDGMGVTTATTVQDALCDILQGIEIKDSATLAAAEQLLGCPYKFVGKPKEVIILAGIRTAKSMLTALAGLYATQTVDIGHLSAGEIPRVALTSLRLDNANVIMGHLIGLLNSPMFKHLLIDPNTDATWGELLKDTSKDTNGSRFVRHPSGRPVEICVLAGSRAGGSLVSRWLVSVGFDEAPRWGSSSDAVVNLEDSAHAVMGRILKGGQIIYVGSPVGPQGFIYDRVLANYGLPTKDLVIIRGTGPMLNPVWWTEERCEEIKRTDPAAYKTDVLAEFLDVEESLFPSVIVERATRLAPLVIPYDRRNQYAAAADPATRGNAWTLVIASKTTSNRKQIVFNRQWIGSSTHPLSPIAVLQEMAEELKKYNLGWCYTDQWSADALKQLALSVGISLIQEDWTAKNRVDCFLSLAAAMANGDIELPPDKQVADDLKGIYRTSTIKGPSVVLPHSRGGRHSDYGPALARVLKKWIDQPMGIDGPKRGTVEYMEQEEKKSVAKLLKSGPKKESFLDKDPGLKMR